MDITEDHINKMIKLVRVTAGLFKEEPSDAADFVDASRDIMTVWQLTNEIKETLPEEILDSVG